MPKTLEFPLGLTSPLTAGPLVREAQRALKHNPFGDFDPGPLDGIYGEQTARATKRAKHWLGWESPNAVYGKFIHAFLVGTAEIPEDQQKRRAKRKVESAAEPLREKALAEALKHIGTKEHPEDSNRVMFSDWYGMIGPWCAMFVTYCYVKAGSVAFDKTHARYAYCPFVVNDARAGRNFLATTSMGDVKPGDLVLYDWAGDGKADHIGLFGSWSGSSFIAIEGNTSPTNNSNGGEVMRRERSIRDVVLFAHVGK